MIPISKCHTVQKKSDSTFTFYGFDESNISDEILSEGDIERELIRKSVSSEDIENSPMERWLYITPERQKEQTFTFLSDPLNSRPEVALKHDSWNWMAVTKSNSNLLKVLVKKPRLNSINGIADFESPIQKEIRSLLQQIIKKKKNSQVHKTNVKISNQLAEPLVTMREITLPSNCFGK